MLKFPPPITAAATELTEGSEDGSWSESEKTEAIIIKPLKSLSVSSNDVRNKLEKTENMNYLELMIFAHRMQN